MSSPSRRAQSDVGTRSEAGCSVDSRASRVGQLRKKTELAKLKVEQERRAATAAAAAREEAAEAEAAAAKAARKAVAKAEAAAEAAKIQAAQDEAELNELELRLEQEALTQSEEDGAAVQLRPPLLRPASLAAAPPLQRRLAASVLPSEDSQERTRSWIERLSNQPVDDSSPNRRHFVDSLPRIKLDKFDGSPLEWPRWSSLFRALVHNHQGLTDTERLTHLQSCLTGEAREAVSGLLCDGQLYSEALSELERQFGTPRHVVRANLGRLLAIPAAKNNDMKSLRNLSTALHNAVMVLSSMGFDADLAATANMEQVVAKLPRALAWRWGEHAMGLRLKSPTLADLDSWLRQHVDAGRLVFEATGDTGPPKTEKTPAERPRRHAFTVTAKAVRRSSTGKTLNICAMCDGSHAVEDCASFASATIDERADIVRKKRLCWLCLREGHMVRSCAVKKPCNVPPGCKGRHHPLLHSAPRLFQPRPAAPAESESSNSCVATTSENVHAGIILQILPVIARGPKGERVINAMLDLGSQVSLVTDQLATDLGLDGPIEPLCLGTVTGSATRASKRVDLQVRPHSGGGDLPVRGARTTPVINVTGPAINWPKEKKNWPHLTDLHLPKVTAEPVHALIGADAIELIMPLAVRQGPAGAPWAVKTRLGWIATGKLPDSALSSGYIRHANCLSLTEDAALHEQVTQWWSTESFGSKYQTTPTRSRQDQAALQILESSTQRAGDRYETGLLWASPNARLAGNFGGALSRLRSMERKLDRDPALAKAYNTTIEEYVREGYARKLSTTELAVKHEREWYLPHHAVISPHKPGKVRVVFDAAARFGGTSLNDCLLAGPDLTNNLVGILMRFRQRPVALTADIQAMFHQVRVRPADQPALRFLWRGSERQQPPDVYQMQVLIFGATSSPCAATYALQRCAEDQQEKYPAAASAVHTRFYVDDYLDSVENVKEALALQGELTNLLNTGGFSLKKWTSTSTAVISKVPPEDRSDGERDLDLDGSRCERALGVVWKVKADTFTFKSTKSEAPVTKRGILSSVSSVFDPLGLLAPWTLRAKALLQDIWRSGCHWDDPLTDIRLAEAWRTWAEELSQLHQFKISRCYRDGAEAPVSTQLHVFSDASELAFGAVAYFRLEYRDGRINTAFVLAKNRVAPLRQMSIPRLELQAAVMAVRIAELIQREHDMEIASTHFWSDSKTVLQWVKSESRNFKTFVANRVAEIQDASDPETWRHCPGVLNPADVCSRGCKMSDLLADVTWQNGPTFLCRPPTEWPADTAAGREIKTNTADLELRAAALVGATAAVDHPLKPGNYSSWLRLLRVTAWIRRFKTNCRTSPSGRAKGPLSAAEIEAAETLWVHLSQQEAFPAELAALKTGRRLPSGSQIIALRPYLDSSGVLRVGGRLQHADSLTHAARHQAILPSRHDVTRLIIADCHRRLAHAGTEHVLSRLRQTHWILRGRAAVKAYAFACPICRQRRAEPRPPVMADLPEARVTSNSPPFTQVGVDYFGPIIVTKFRRQEKRYGCLFTCLATRAVHLEIAHSLDTDSLIMCLRRMIARRGQPKIIHSDNGTNMRGAERELKNSIQQWNQQQIADTLSQRGIEWRFIPPASPHFGGAWERLVRSVKVALRIVVGRQVLRDETLATFMAEVEALLNSRPLTHVSSDPDDLEPLTPNHLLLGRASPSLPPGVFSETDLSSQKRWRHGQRLADEFWRRWRREYLPTLTTRRKWTADGVDLCPGALVLISEDNTPRGMWTMARVLKPIVGRDGRVRAAVVKTPLGELTRPAARLCVLEDSQ